MTFRKSAEGTVRKPTGRHPDWKRPVARAALLAMIAVSACGGDRPSTPAPPPSTVCDAADSILSQTAFVIVTNPSAGEQVTSRFEVAGCSSTFESNVVWELRARDGSLLASGYTMGGSLDGPAPFSFTVTANISTPQLGHLEVSERDESDGEGFPPGRTVLPLRLAP